MKLKAGVVYHGMDLVQILDLAPEPPIYGPFPIVMPPPVPEREYIFGIIRKPPEVAKLGTRRQKQPYSFVKGKRVSDRSQRWGR